MSSIWSKLVNLAGNITGTLPVANGGTGLTAGTSGGVLAYTAAGTLASSGALTAHGVVVGGGAGVVPAVTAAGTTGQLLVGVSSADPAWGNTVALATTYQSAATAQVLVTQNTASLGQGVVFKNTASSGKFNFFVGCQASANANNAIEFTPSTSADGATFSTPIGLATSGGFWTLINPTAGGGSFGSQVLTLQNTNGAGQGLVLKNTAASGKKNFLIGCQVNANNAIEFTPSDTNDSNDFNTPKMTIASDGTVTMSKYGTGTATFSSSGVISSVSDSRLKTELPGDIPGLKAVLQLRPRRYAWTDPKKFGDEIMLGLFAQEAGKVIPEALGTAGVDGMHGMHDRAIAAALVKAIQELNGRLEALEAK